LPCLSFPSRLERAPLPGAIDAGGTLLGKRVVTSEELPQIGGSPIEDGILCGDFDAGYELVRIGDHADPGRYLRQGQGVVLSAQRFGGRRQRRD
jgi:HK97 family phage major capsid protein